MSIYAAIFDNNKRPLTSDIEINDDLAFTGLESQAVAIAASGTKCCIRWIREDDGQVAYWGPHGAEINPHWYTTPSRGKS